MFQLCHFLKKHFCFTCIAEISVLFDYPGGEFGAASTGKDKTQRIDCTQNKHNNVKLMKFIKVQYLATAYPGRYSETKLGRSVRPASQNPNPMYHQNLRFLLASDSEAAAYSLQ